MSSTTEHREAKPLIGDKAAFWGAGLVNALFLFAAAAPSPLYGTYLALYRFQPVTLTVIFAVYAFGLLIGLLVTGRLSDHIGRKPVILGAILLEIVSMVMFVLTDSTFTLGAARTVQGIATGVVLGVISAVLVELSVAVGPAYAPLLSGTSPTGGMAIGAVASAVLVQYAPHPLRLIYCVIFAGLVISFVFMAGIRETGARRPGALGSLKPVVQIPPESRSTFLKVLWPLISLWALIGLFLSLSAILIGHIEGSTNKLWGGAAIFCLTATGALAVIVWRNLTTWTAMVFGSVALFVGVGLIAAAIAVGNGPFFLVSAVIAGVGFGTAFTASLKAVIGVTPADKRAGTLAAFFTVSYLAMSVPIVAAGLAEQQWSAHNVALVYCAAVAVLGGIGILTSIPNLQAETAARNNLVASRPRHEGATQSLTQR